MTNQSASSAIAEIRRNNPQIGINEDVSGSFEESDPLEHFEQCAVVAWVESMKSVWPELRLFHSTPNGGYRHPATARAMKDEGALAGYPDLSLPVSRRMPDGTLYLSLVIEMKRMGGRVRPEQQAILELLRQAGNLAVVAYGASEAIAILKHYLGAEI